MSISLAGVPVTSIYPAFIFGGLFRAAQRADQRNSLRKSPQPDFSLNASRS
jgi:hypothetical protein